MVKWLGKQYRSIYKRIQSFLHNHAPYYEDVPDKYFDRIDPNELTKVHNGMLLARADLARVVANNSAKFISESVMGSYSVLANHLQCHISEECVNDFIVPAVLKCLKYNFSLAIDAAIEGHKKDPIIKIKYATPSDPNVKH